MESNDIQKLIAKEKGRRSSISSESLKLINLNDSQERFQIFIILKNFFRFKIIKIILALMRKSFLKK
jgi:hypothetical protein